jgi:multicomponent Na+:H+ antiporter subunit G
MSAGLAALVAVLVAVGCFFFLAGTVGMLRFPDTHTRLHALTKADSLGLGFIVLGLALAVRSPAVVIKLLFIWLLVLAASSTVCYLIAGVGKRSGEDDPQETLQETLSEGRPRA